MNSVRDTEEFTKASHLQCLYLSACISPPVPLSHLQCLYLSACISPPVPVSHLQCLYLTSSACISSTMPVSHPQCLYLIYNACMSSTMPVFFTCDLKIGTPVAALPGAWHNRLIGRTGWPSVSLPCLGETAGLVCIFCLSVTARTLV